MPGFVLQAERPIEYAILIRPRPAGPLLGFYRDQPIAEAVIDHFGCRYIFAGIATRRRDGKFDARSLGRQERLMEPGLVYRKSDDQARRP